MVKIRSKQVRIERRKNSDGADYYVLVTKALENPKWKYRTISGIAKETKLPEPVVINVISSSAGSIRKSVVGSKAGKDLFTLKKSTSAVEDYWRAFRRLNSEKFQ